MRLTNKSEYCEWCDFDKNTCKMYENCYERKIVAKLREYEDLEESCIEKCGCNLHMVIQKYTEFLEHMHELAEYWELEEQGLLLRLPCKVGDVAYCFGYPRTDIVALVEEKVEEIYVTEIGVRFGTDDGYYSPDDVGRIVFFNREQAEAALEELKERKI